MDREKVIKSLKWFRDRDSWREGIMIHDDHAEVRKRICDNALALLKEQEAVEPIKPLDKDDDYTFLCSNCKGVLFCGDILRDNYCPTCGRSVKWK